MRNRHLTCFLFSLSLLLGLGTSAYCQDHDIPKDLYAASTIPDSLKKHANSTIRYSETDINIKGPGKVTIKLHKIVTVLNEKGNKEAEIAMLYNRKYNTYSKIVIGIFDENGVPIKKYHKSDMYDGSAANDATIVTDERFLVIKHNIATYPVTIETEYEEDVNSFIDLGSWVIQQTGQSVQNEIIQVMATPSIGFRYKTEHIETKPDKEKVNGSDLYTWKFNGLKALRNPDNVLSWKISPQIEFAVNHFDCYGYPGDFTSWQSFGKWIQSLNNDVCTLNPQRAEEVRKMTDSIKTDKGKAKFLYNYLQQNVRYVNIQLGIGGFKPFPATFVDQNKYGDCKALSNYMRALLKAVNIKADYTIVGAGNAAKPVDPLFPINTFNHVILCIPFKNDTTWLECTSNTQPFGKLGPFTENRTALLIADDGSKLVNTPKSAQNDNRFTSEVHIILHEDGGATAQVKILCTGEYRLEYIKYASLKTDGQKQLMMNLLHIKQPSVFELNPAADQDGTKELDIHLTYDKFCDITTGDKQFYHPNILDLSTFSLPVETKRKTDYTFNFPLEKSCATTIRLPAGFEVETLPANQSLKFTYGNYEINYVYDPVKNEVTSTAKFILTNRVVPAPVYTEMQQYFEAVAKAQNKMLVIRRKA